MRTVATMVVLFLIVGCASESPNKVEKIDPSTLVPGPIRHENLSDQQIGRLKAVHAKLAEVDRSPLEKWIDDFKRDMNPDSEIAIYEAIAFAYVSFVDKKSLSRDQKLEAYGLLLMRSGTDTDDALRSFMFKYLTPEQGRELLSGYKLKANPITVERH